MNACFGFAGLILGGLENLNAPIFVHQDSNLLALSWIIFDHVCILPLSYSILTPGKVNAKIIVSVILSFHFVLYLCICRLEQRGLVFVLGNNFGTLSIIFRYPNKTSVLPYLFPIYDRL